MALADQIVEGRIGSPDEIEQFVRDALPKDFMLERLDVKREGDFVLVYDKKTGTPLCYLRWRPSDRGRYDSVDYSIATSHTSRNTSRVLRRENDISMEEWGMLARSWFPSWRRAVASFLAIPAAQDFAQQVMGIKESLRTSVYAFGYENRLEAVIQPLADRGLFIERVGLRVGKGPSCYMIAQTQETDSGKVVEALRSSLSKVGLALDDPKAVMRNEATWQVDFKVPNLFEAEDYGEFVTTAFREEVPGYAELERAAKLRDDLRASGVPVRRIDIETYRTNSKTVAEPDRVHYAVWCDFIAKRAPSKGKLIAAAERSLNRIGVSPDDPPRSVFLTLTGVQRADNPVRNISITLSPAGRPLEGRTMIESEEDYAEFGEIAAARQGTIGDELRLKRLMQKLKALGFRMSGAKMCQQHTPIWSTGTYNFYVSYSLENVYSSTLSVSDFDAQKQVHQIVYDIMVADKEISGAEPPLFCDITVWGNTQSGYSVHTSVKSLRTPSPLNPNELPDRRDITLESESEDYEEYADAAIAATPGMRTRLWLKKLKASLEAKGVTVRSIDATVCSYKMRVVTKVNSYDGSSPDLRRFIPSEILRMWGASVRETGNLVIIDGGDTLDVIPDTTDPNRALVFTIRGNVGCLEGRLWPEGSKVSENIISTDDLDLEEFERLNAIAMHAERAYSDEVAGVAIPLYVLYCSAETVPEKSGYPAGTVLVRMRIATKYDTGSAAYAFIRAINRGGYDIVHGDNAPMAAVGMNNAGPLGDGYVESGGYQYTDVYAHVTPVGPPIQRRVECPGPSADRWPDYATFGKRKLGETIDAEDEVWIRQVIDATPGYKDMERLKSAVRSIEEMGFEVTGVTQRKRFPKGDTTGGSGPWKWDTELSVVISIKRKPGDTATTACLTRQGQKIALALEAHWEILDLRHKYDTTDALHSVWEWFWHSHDAPQDIVPFTLRYGSWNEYLNSGLAELELDMFLVEHSEIPGDDLEDTYSEIFNQAQTDADPLWRERIRLRAIADEIKAAGYGGYVKLAFNNDWLESAELFLGFTHPDPERMDSYFVRALVIRLNDKYHFASPGTVWAMAHDLNQSHTDEDGNPQSRMYVPYMYLGNERKSGRVPDNLSQIYVPVNEALKLTPEEMDELGNEAIKPYRKLEAAQQAYKAFVKTFKDMFPGIPGRATFYQSPLSHGSGGTYLFQIWFDDEAACSLLRNSYAEQHRVGEIFRKAVLNSGLKQYRPRSRQHSKWPRTDVGPGAGTKMSIVLGFSLIMPFTVPDKLTVIPDVRQHVMEGEDWTPDEVADWGEQAYRAVDPVFTEQERLNRLAADLSSSLGGLAVRGQIILISPRMTADVVREGSMYIYIFAHPWYNNHERLEIGQFQVMGTVYGCLLNHGYGSFEVTTTHANGTMEMLPALDMGSGKPGWRMNAYGVKVSTDQFDTLEAKFGGAAQESKKFDPGVRHPVMEGEDWTPQEVADWGEQAYRAVDPVFVEWERLERLGADLATKLAEYSIGGKVGITSPSSTKFLSGLGLLDIYVIAHPGLSSKADLDIVQYMVLEIVSRCLPKHGYGTFAISKSGKMGTLSAIPDTNIFDGKPGWVLIATGAHVLTDKFDSLEVTFGSYMKEDVSVDPEFDPEELIRQTLGDTDPHYEIIGQLQAVAQDLKASHWDWIQSGTIRTVPCEGTMRPMLVILMHLLMRPDQIKPKAFAWDVVRQAMQRRNLEVEGFLERCYNPTPDSVMFRFQMNAPAAFVGRKFPDVYIDIQEARIVEANEIGKAGRIDPEELALSSEEGTRFGLYRSLQQIAASLAAKGWQGYLHSLTRHSYRGLANLDIRMTKFQPTTAPRPMTTEVNADVAAAFQGFYIDNGPTVGFSTSRIPGYTENDASPWHWTAQVMINLRGTQPSIYADGSATVYCDIGNGSISVGSGERLLRGRIGAPQEA